MTTLAPLAGQQTSSPPDQPTSPPEQNTSGTKDPSNHSAVIVGGVLGGLSFLLGLLAAFWLYRRFQRNHIETPTLKPFSTTIHNHNAAQPRFLNSSQPPLHRSSHQVTHEENVSSPTNSSRYLSSSERRSSTGHPPNTPIQYRSMERTLVSTGKIATSPTSQPSDLPLDWGSEGRRAPYEVAEEIRRLREELRGLERSVPSINQTHGQDDDEAPPAYR